MTSPRAGPPGAKRNAAGSEDSAAALDEGRFKDTDETNFSSASPAKQFLRAEQLASIPAELRSRAQWTNWHAIRGNGKTTKPPCDARTGKRIDATAPNNWITFDEAVERVRKYSSNADGIGYCFSAEDPFVGIDFDHCRDPDTGNHDPAVEAAIRRLNSYTEKSPSGAGYHTIVRAQYDGSGRRQDGIEVYSHSRYFTVTGQRVLDLPPTIEPRQAELDALMRELVGNGATMADPFAMEPAALKRVPLAELRIPGDMRDLIRAGHDPSRYASRSESLFAALRSLVRAGYDDETILAVVMDSSNGISGKPLERGRHWTAGQVQAARTKPGNGGSNTTAQQAAQGAGADAGSTVAPGGQQQPGAPAQVGTAGGQQWQAPPPRIRLIPFEDFQLGSQSPYLVRNLVPRIGHTVIWGEPKSGKTFWTFDLMMHVALGWEYRGHRVQQGAVVYVAAEGIAGLRARKAAFAKVKLMDHRGPVPFFFVPVNLDLIKEHGTLMEAIRAALAGAHVAAVVIDTMNRTLRGSESRDEDMSRYIEAADAIRDAFSCAVVIVHHSGLDPSRPRGHTSLTAAADAQISVKRRDEIIYTLVEWMKDGAEGESTASRLLTVDLGLDDDGETIDSCVVEPTERPAPSEPGPKLGGNQRVMYDLLKASDGLTLEEWYGKARNLGVGVSRPAALSDARIGLENKGLVERKGEYWFAV